MSSCWTPSKQEEVRLVLVSEAPAPERSRRERIRREKQLSVSEAVGLARKIADTVFGRTLAMVP